MNGGIFRAVFFEHMWGVSEQTVVILNLFELMVRIREADWMFCPAENEKQQKLVSKWMTGDCGACGSRKNQKQQGQHLGNNMCVCHRNDQV